MVFLEIFKRLYNIRDNKGGASASEKAWEKVTNSMTIPPIFEQ